MVLDAWEGGQFRYCFGSTQTTWGALRAADGHLASWHESWGLSPCSLLKGNDSGKKNAGRSSKTCEVAMNLSGRYMISCMAMRRKEPYKMFSFEIGNEQKLDMLLVQQVCTKCSQEFLSICLFIPCFRCNVRYQCMTAGTLCNTVSIQCCTLPAASLNPAGGSHLQGHETTSRRSEAANAAVGGGAKHWNVGQPSGVPVWNNTLKSGVSPFSTIPYLEKLRKHIS